MRYKALKEEIVWRKNEADVDRLVEERGVGASKYNDTIDKVILFCQNYIKTNRKNMPDGWKFAVDKKIVREFDFFDYLRLVITIKDIGEQPLNYSGGGRSYSYEDSGTFIKNGRFIGDEEIRLYGYSKGSNLYSRTILNSLYHELNHKIEDLHRAGNSEDKGVYQQTVFYQDIKDVKFSDDENVNNAIYNVVYRAFSTTEFNALTSGVYGDLKGIDSERKNWRTDIMLTQAYAVYDDLRDCYGILYKADENVYKKLKEFFDDSIVQGYKKAISVMDFKIWFLSRLSDRINTLYKNIGRAASLWYDDKEKPVDDNVGEICVGDDGSMNVPLIKNPEFQKYLKTFKRLTEYK